MSDQNRAQPEPPFSARVAAAARSVAKLSAEDKADLLVRARVLRPDQVDDAVRRLKRAVKNAG